MVAIFQWTEKSTRDTCCCHNRFASLVLLVGDNYCTCLQRNFGGRHRLRLTSLRRNGGYSACVGRDEANPYLSQRNGHSSSARPLRRQEMRRLCGDDCARGNDEAKESAYARLPVNECVLQSVHALSSGS